MYLKMLTTPLNSTSLQVNKIFGFVEAIAIIIVKEFFSGKTRNLACVLCVIRKD